MGRGKMKNAKRKKIFGRTFQISLTNLLSLVLSMLAIGVMVGMASLAIGWIIIGFFVIMIIFKSLPYLEKVSDAIDKMLGRGNNE